jgi:hypothetical protein
VHDQLSEILGEEVVGEVTRVGDRFFDVGLGRICLEPLVAERARGLVAKLRETFRDDIRVDDQLHLDEPQRLRRGILEVRVLDPKAQVPYRLQISSTTVLALYQRRFWLAPETTGDLMASFCRGLALICEADVEKPLRALSGYDAMRERFVAALDSAVRGTASPVDVAGEIEALSAPMRAAWRLIPWPLKAALRPATKEDDDRVIPHDEVMRRTVMFATDLEEGKVVYQYAHEHHPVENYNDVLSWMTEIHASISETYPAPRHAGAVARASSVGQFIEAFPRFQRVVGEPGGADVSPP